MPTCHHITITSTDTDSNNSIQKAKTDSPTSKHDYYDLDLASQSLNEPCPDGKETNGEKITYNFSSSELSTSIEDETDNEKIGKRQRNNEPYQ